jgi:hypothetical protein
LSPNLIITSLHGLKITFMNVKVNYVDVCLCQKNLTKTKGWQHLDDFISLIGLNLIFFASGENTHIFIQIR